MTEKNLSEIRTDQPENKEQTKQWRCANSNCGELFDEESQTTIQQEMEKYNEAAAFCKHCKHTTFFNDEDEPYSTQRTNIEDARYRPY